MKIPVLLPNIFNYPFTYETDLKLKTGDYVQVPFGKNKKIGVVWDYFQNDLNKKIKIKKIIKKINIKSLNNKTINFLNWFSKYNLVPVGMSLKLHLLNSEAVENLTDKEYLNFELANSTKKFKLTDEQLNALNSLNKNINKFRVHLLQGTTGSGKTIVYFETIKKILEKKKQTLILLPEIGLTKEFEKKFLEFFGFKPAVWHSGVTKKQKKIIWSGLNSGKIKVVIGARSSLFLPFNKLGIIIVDEEHDQSYKQDEGIIYNARDMAISRAFFENIPINLVTAVPSLETFRNVINGKYLITKISERYKKANLPNYEIIDLKKYKVLKNSWISQKTFEKVKEHLQKGDQVLFFLNRRGYAPFAFCKKCLNTFKCPNCSVNLVYHKKNNKLICHYCGYKNLIDRNCQINRKCELIFTGPGVERINDEVQKLFSEYKTLIFSSDTMNRKNSVINLDKIVNNKIKIIIGTQLISKGFHFPNLNCVVVLDIDLTSNGHDLRVAEKNLQLYHQLSGRAGRGGKKATVYFQTYNINSNLISEITNSDPFIFLRKELELRKKHNLPPYERFISLILSSQNQTKLDEESYKLKEYLNKKVKGTILGPINAPIYKIRKNYRNRILIRSKKRPQIQSVLSIALKNYNLSSGIKLSVDVDPISFN